MFLQAVLQFGNPFFAGAMGTAVEGAIGLHPVPDDLATAMAALWGQSMDGALKTVEYVGLSIHPDFECLVILVSADFAFGHLFLLFPLW